MQNLHLCLNDHLDTSDKIAKMRPLLNLMNACLKHIVPQQTIGMDEPMVPYFGCHGAKQYIKGKPYKFGYRMWVAATCDEYRI